MGFITGMLAGLRRRYGDPKALLDELDIKPASPASRVPIAGYVALYNRLCRQYDDEAFALFAQPMRTGSFEFLCRGCLSAPTLAEALTRAGRFLHVALPDLAVSIHRAHGQAELIIAETRKLAENCDAPGRVFAFEWLLRLLHGLACWLVGRGIGLDNIIFPYRKPAHFADYALIFTEDSRFAPTVPGGNGMLVASFNANLLDLPVRRDEAALTRLLDDAPGKITLLYRRDREMVTRVRDLLRAALPAMLGLDDIAGLLYLSPRTIHRRLEAEGSSFRTVKDALRRDLALDRLAKRRDPIAQIAADLGYADTSAFYRACVGWTGMAPIHYRRQWLNQESPASPAIATNPTNAAEAPDAWRRIPRLQPAAAHQHPTTK